MGKKRSIAAFLEVLKADICNGKDVGELPGELAEAMLRNENAAVDVNKDIEGEVALVVEVTQLAPATHRQRRP